jgi:hypothetical protein
MILGAYGFDEVSTPEPPTTGYIVTGCIDEECLIRRVKWAADEAEMNELAEEWKATGEYARVVVRPAP